MLLIRDYLEGASLGTSVRNYARLRRAALQVETADRGKIIAKAAVIGLASMLPRAAGVKLLEAVYLPNNLKRLTSRVARAVA
jgi:hypothetical protein